MFLPHSYRATWGGAKRRADCNGSEFVTEESTLTIPNIHVTQQSPVCESTLLAAVYHISLCIDRARCDRNNKSQGGCGWKVPLEVQPPFSSRDPPGASGTGLDGFWMSSKMETSQCPGQPVQVVNLPHCKKHIFLRGSLLCFSLWSLDPYPVTGNYLKRDCHPVLCTLPSGIYMHWWDPPLLQAEQSQLSQSFFIRRCCSPLFALVALYWLLSSSFMYVLLLGSFQEKLIKSTTDQD